MNIGIMLESFNPSELVNSFVENTNKYLLSSSSAISISGFFDTPAPLEIIPKFPIMQSHEAWSFNGYLVATNLKTARKALKCPGTKQKFFYVWDLEWVHEKNQLYLDFGRVYQSKELGLITRNKDDLEAVEDCWNRKVCGIVKEFNMNQLVEVLSNDRHN